MIIDIIQDLALTAGGGTHQLNVAAPYTIANITGNATMTSSWTISTTGTVQKGMRAVLSYQATMDFDGNDLTILGKAIPASMQAKPFHVIGIYDGAAWHVVIVPDVATSESFPGDAITQSSLNGNRIVNASISLLKLATLSEGNIIIGDNSGVPTALDVSTDAAILIGDGSSAAPQVISGDVLINNAGVATIPAGTITEDQLAFPVGDLFVLPADLDETTVNASNGEPYVIYPTSSVAADEAVSVVQAFVRLVSAGVAFAFADDLVIETISGQTLATFAEVDLEGTSTRIFSATLPSSVDLVLNSGLQIRSLTSNPSGGTGASLHFRLLAKKHNF